MRLSAVIGMVLRIAGILIGAFPIYAAVIGEMVAVIALVLCIFIGLLIYSTGNLFSDFSNSGKINVEQAFSLPLKFILIIFLALLVLNIE